MSQVLYSLYELCKPGTSSTYRPDAASCNLCLDKKLAILLADPYLIKERNSPASVVTKINSN